MDIKKRNKAINEWQKATKDRVNMLFPRGFKDRLQAGADEVGESMSQYVVNAVDMRINGALSSGSRPESVNNNIVQSVNYLSKPQPSPELIASNDRTKIVLWLFQNGWADDEVKQFLADNNLNVL